MPLAPQVSVLATRVAQEFKAVRSEMAALGGGSDPWTYAWINTAVTATTTTAVDVHAGFTPLANRRYILEAKLIETSAATTTGAQFALLGPTTGVTRSAVKIATATSNTADKVDHLALNGYQIATASPTGATFAFIDAMLDFATPGAGNVRVSVRSEVANSAITVQPGSYVRWRLIP